MVVVVVVVVVGVVVVAAVVVVVELVVRINKFNLKNSFFVELNCFSSNEMFSDSNHFFN